MTIVAEKTLRDNTPDELKTLAQWLPWCYERRPGTDKEAKVPYDPRTGKRADYTDPATWVTFYEALEAYEAGGYAGIGLVFSQDDPYGGADFDHCRNPETGEIAGWVLEWVEAFGGYAEVSPSGTGLHIVVRGTAPNRNNRRAGVEAYSKERFLTFTGSALGAGAGSPVPERQEVLDRLSAQFFPPKPDANPVPAGERRPVTLEDEELLNKARSAGRGMGERFRALYDRGEWLEHPSHSEARHELLRQLGFWTRRDPERMAQLYEGSALYAEPGYAQKWSRLAERECRRAIAGTPKVYRGGAGSSAGGRSGRAEVNEALDRFDAAIRSHPWGRWRSGLSITKALLIDAREAGRMRPDGNVEFDSSQLGVASRAKVSPKTAERYARRIEETGLVRKDNADRKLWEATTWVLIIPPPARDDGTQKPVGNNNPRGDSPSTVISREPLPLTRPRLRASERYIRRLGKSWEACRDELEAHSGKLSYEDAAALLGIRDVRHLKRPQPDSWVLRAERAGLVRRTSWGFFFEDGWEEREDRARERAGELAADVRDAEMYKRMRKDWVSPLPDKKKRPESEAEQAARRELELLRKAGAERKRYGREFKQHTRARARARRGEEVREGFVTEGFAERRREAIEAAIARLFEAKPEYRSRRVGQITCALIDYLSDGFPRGKYGVPKDREVEEIFDGHTREAS